MNSELDHQIEDTYVPETSPNCQPVEEIINRARKEISINQNELLSQIDNYYDKLISNLNSQKQKGYCTFFH